MRIDHPDPAVTANIFAALHLDAVLANAVAPAVAALHAPDDAYVWWMRCGQRGDHIKLRLHASEAVADRFRGLLAKHTAQCFEAIGEVPGSGYPIASGAPIDREDEADDAPGDKSLEWSTYRRSHVCFGEKVLYEHDLYSAHLTRSLGRGAAMILNRIEPGTTAPWSHQARFNMLFKAIVDGLGELRLSAETRRAFLTYHRDWLLRYSAPKDQPAPEDQAADRPSADQVFDRRLAKMPDGGQSLFTFARSRRSQVEASGDGQWAGDLAAAWEVFEPLAEAHASDIDAYADIPAFSPLFKVFQGLANQAGLNLVEEAYIHHILLRTEDAEDADEEPT